MDVEISHQRLSKQFVHQTKVLTKLVKNMEKICILPNGYEKTKESTFQNNACFSVFGQFHNGGYKNTNSDPTKHPNPLPNPSPASVL